MTETIGIVVPLDLINDVPLAHQGALLGFYVRAWLYATNHRTDGHVPAAWVLEDVRGAFPNTARLAKLLVKAKLWEDTPEGWRICGFNLTVPCATEQGRVELRRDRDRVRKRRWRTPEWDMPAAEAAAPAADLPFSTNPDTGRIRVGQWDKSGLSHCPTAELPQVVDSTSGLGRTPPLRTSAAALSNNLDLSKEAEAVRPGARGAWTPAESSRCPTSAVPPRPLQTDEVFTLYRRHRGSLPNCRGISADRQKLATRLCCEVNKAALAEAHDTGTPVDPRTLLVQAITTIAATPWMTGKGDVKGWTAGIDYLLKPGTWARALEGYFAQRPKKQLTAEETRQDIRNGNIAHVLRGPINIVRFNMDED